MHSHLEKSFFFRVLSLASCLAVLFSGAGCSKQVAVESTVFKKRYETDKRAEAAMVRGDFQKGILLYERLIKKDPSNALAWYHLGYAYGQVGDHYREISFYKKAIELKYRTEQIYYNLGEAYLEIDQVEEAIQAFKRGVKTNPGNADNYFGLGRSYQRRLEYAPAEKEILKAVRLAPQDIVFREYLGSFYEETGQLQKAAEQYRIILEIDPDYEGALERLDHVVEKQRSVEESKRGMGGQTSQ